MNPSQYRPELDGLRAVAIIPVILFHIDSQLIQGGFLGVDVFFVISGFLITSVLLGELHAGSFSLRRFWSRRICRILPALIVVTAVVLVFTAIFVYPPDRPVIGHQAIATLLSVANVYFWRNAGDYWGPRAEESPFLHAWSLSVEEQFYVIYPLFLCALVRWAPKKVVPGLLAIVVVSLVATLAGLAIAPAATFYNLPSRAWELAVGGLLASIMLGKDDGRVCRAGSPLLAGVGAVASIMCFFLVSRWNAFAIVPVAGAAAVIYGGSRGWAYRVLSNPILVHIGKISYSLYLWHWPLIVLSRAVLLDMPTFVFLPVLTGLATASHRFVEEPLRRRKGIVPRIAIVGACTLLLAVALAVMQQPSCDVSAFEPPTSFNHVYDTHPHRVVSSEWKEIYATSELAMPSFGEDDYRLDGHIVGCEDGLPKVVLFGDSHGTMWSHVLRVAAEQCRVKAALYGMNGVPPAISFPPSRSQLAWQLSSAEKYEFDMARIRSIEQWRPAMVFICARWSTRQSDDYSPLLGFLDKHGVRVVLVEQPPELAAVGSHIARDFVAFHGIRPQPGVRQYWKAGNVRAYEGGRRKVRLLARQFKNVEVMETADLYSVNGKVWLLDGTTLLYEDDNHLTEKGTALALPRMCNMLMMSSPGSRKRELPETPLEPMHDNQ